MMLSRALIRRAAATATARACLQSASATRGLSVLAAAAVRSVASAARPTALRLGWMPLAAVHVGGAAPLAAYGTLSTAEAAAATFAIASKLDGKEFVPLKLLKVSAEQIDLGGGIRSGSDARHCMLAVGRRLRRSPSAIRR